MWAVLSDFRMFALQLANKVEVRLGQCLLGLSSVVLRPSLHAAS
jgi:hypothetical protein